MTGRALAAAGRAGLFAIVFAAACFLAFLGDAWLAGRPVDSRLRLAIALFAAGAFMAGFLAWLIAGRMLAGKVPTARFAGATVLLTLGTPAASAFAFFLQYRLYYAAWHGPPLTLGWVFELIFTGVGAAYLFVVTGLPLFLPLGLPVLFGAAAAITAWAGRPSA